MKITKYLKLAVAFAGLSIGSAHAIDATIGGTVPNVSYLIVNTEKYLDFSSPAVDLQVAEILVNSNSVNWAVDLSWDAAAMAFNGADAINIYSDVSIVTAAGVGGNGTGLDGTPDAGYAAAANRYTLPIGVTVGALGAGGLECALWAAGIAGPNTACAANTPYVADDVIRIGNTLADGSDWVAAGADEWTATTTNAPIQVLASWDAAEDQDYTTAYATDGTTLFAGSYTQTLTAVINTTL